MGRLKTLFIFLAFMLPLNSWATFELGVGATSVTSGRFVPSLAGSYYGQSWGVSAFSTGVQTSSYFQSAYGLNVLWLWPSGEFLSGPIQSGFGFGFYYGTSGYQDTGASTEEAAGDYTLGPSFRVNWTFLDPLYINLEGTFGILSPGYIVQLSAQDVVSFSIGWRIW